MGGVAAVDQSCERVAAWAFVNFCWLLFHTAAFSSSGHYVASFRLFLGGLHASILGRFDFSINRLWTLAFWGECLLYLGASVFIKSVLCTFRGFF